MVGGSSRVSAFLPLDSAYFPEVLVIEIFKWLDIGSLCAISSVSRGWYQKDTYKWRLLCDRQIRDYADQTSELAFPLNCKKVFFQIKALNKQFQFDTPGFLHAAAGKGYAETLCLFATHSQKRRYSFYAQIALAPAIANKRDRVVDALLKCGADVEQNIYYSEGHSFELNQCKPLVYVARQIQHCFDQQESLQSMLSIMHRLLQSGADVEAQDEDKDKATALMYSVKAHGAVQLLLEHKANVCAVDQWGRRAIDYAKTHGNADSIRLLLDAEATN